MRLRTIHLVAVLLALAAGPLTGSPLNIQEPPQADIVIRLNARDLKDLTLLRQTEDVEGQAVPFTAKAGDLNDERVLTWPCAPGEYIVRTATLVSRPLRVEGCPGRWVVPLAPSATVGGMARVAAANLPRALSVTVRACPPPRRSETQGTYRVRLAPDGSFSATLQAACVDLLIGARDFAPVPVPRFALKAGEQRTLEPLTLKPGATVTVTARAWNGEPVPGAVVSVVPAADYVQFVDDVVYAGRAAKSAPEAVTNADGTAHVIGITALLAYAVVRSGDRMGFAGPVELQPGEQYVLEPIVLTQGGTVSVSATGDRSWMAAGTRLSATGSPIVAGQSLRGTSVEFALPGEENTAKPVPLAGRWRFSLRSDGAILDQQDVDIVPEAHTHVQLAISQRMFRGRVLVGDAGMAGTLTLRQPMSKGGWGAVTAVDEEGRFVAPLPEAGTYLAAFSSRDKTFGVSTTAEFLDGRETTVRIPLARLTGEVVLADGAPAPRALVLLSQPPARLMAGPALASDGFRPIGMTDGTGAFVIPFVAPGEWDVRAERGSLTSAPQTVSVGDSSPPPVRLVLDQDSGVTLRVVNVRGESVARAQGLAFGAQVGGMLSSRTISTDSDGRCRLSLEWSRGSAVTFVLRAPGYPVAAIRAVPDEQGMVVLTMPASGGQVRLTTPRADSSPSGLASEVGVYVLVNDQGAIVPLSTLTAFNAATLVPTPTSWTVVIPSLASGEWQLAKLPGARSGPFYLSGYDPLPVVRTFTVVPGGSVVVDLK